MSNNLKISSNRNFGLVFSVFFLILGLWPLINNNAINIWLIIISLIFLFLGLMNSKILYPLNKLWFKFGIALGTIIAPIVMGIIFFFLITPIGLLMKITGKDLLNTKYNKKINSYWIKRDKSVDSMKKQF